MANPDAPVATARPRPVALCILDGWGWREERADNAVAQAKTPVFDRLWASSPRCFLRTDGFDVGLPEGQFGNSEVGHMNLGAGRVVMQELPRIDLALRDGSLAANPGLAGAIDRLRATGGRMHLLGLMSPGGVHAHQAHIAGLCRILDAAGIEVVVHAFMDGRDTPPRGGAGYLRAFLAAIDGCTRVSIATVTGRYFAMDRDHRWERVSQAYAAIAEGKGIQATDAIAAVEDAYRADEGDEFIKARVVAGYAGMRDGDGLIAASFRADRIREILTALLDPGFTGFARGKVVGFATSVGMTSYGEELDTRLTTLFPPQPLDRMLSEVVAEAGLTQLHMAETEKYPHVTFFFNGGEERPYPGEERIMVPSPKVATYDLQPEMSAGELADRCVAAVATGRFDFVLINFANPDMVGHTGILAAAIQAVEAVDACLGRIVNAVERQGGCLIVTADHGNCEVMRDAITGEPHTSHTLNPVPCMLVGGPSGATLRDGGRLADVAPTLLALMGQPQPPAMTGVNLIRHDAATAG